MNKIFASAIMAVAMLGSVSEAEACTNFIVGKKASVDGSVMCSYSADDYGMFQNLCHHFDSLTGSLTTLQGNIDE